MEGTELLIILAIILLFFGATRVPRLGRSLGQGMRELRKGISEDPDRRGEVRARQFHDGADGEKASPNGAATRGGEAAEAPRAGQGP